MRKELKQANLKQAIVIGCAVENITLTELAGRIGKDQSNLSTMLTRGNPSLDTLIDMLNKLNARLIIEYSDGGMVELKIDEV